LRIWNLETRRCIRAITAHDAAVLTVAAIGDGRVATGGTDGRIKVWSGAGEELASIDGHTDWVWKIVRLTDRLMASASEDGSVKVWTTDTFEMVVCLNGPDALRTIAASPDGTTLVTGDVAGRLRFWKNLRVEPSLAAEIAAHRAAVRCVQFIDDETVASGSEDFHLKIWWDWPLRPGYESRHENFVTDFQAFDRNRGVSCSYDGKISFHHWRVQP
jgi:WD40 repeat protein